MFSAILNIFGLNNDDEDDEDFGDEDDEEDDEDFGDEDDEEIDVAALFAADPEDPEA